MQNLDQQTLNELKVALEKEKGLLIDELSTIAKPADRPIGNWNKVHTEFSEDEITSSEALQNDESADESEEDEKNESLAQHLELRLRDVNIALDKIQNGAYGACETCLQPISAERLKADPAAKTDVEHAG